MYIIYFITTNHLLFTFATRLIIFVYYMYAFVIYILLYYCFSDILGYIYIYIYIHTYIHQDNQMMGIMSITEPPHLPISLFIRGFAVL